MKKQRTAAIAMVLTVLAVAPTAQYAMADLSGTATRSVIDRSAPRSSQSPKHLYVVDLQGAVYRFPLAHDGLPALQPDGVLYPQGTIYPTGVAVDKAGHIFVAGADNGAVAEFAAGATGNQKPISTLDVGAADRLSFDDVGHLYVHLDSDMDIEVFAQGAHGHDAPISIVAKYGFEVDYVIAKSGTLYVLNNANAVAVYNKPLNNPSHPDRRIFPDGNFYEFTESMALDEATNRLYVQFYVGFPKYWNKVNYDVRPPSGAMAANAPQPWIYTGDCGYTGDSAVFGTVIVKKYLIVSCNYNADILVYRTDQLGRQRAPVETLGQGMLVSPYEMAVGP